MAGKTWDKEHIRSELEGDWAPVYAALVPNGKLVGRGAWRSALCPFHDDHNPSLSVNVIHGGWRCHAGCGSGDAFSFVMQLEQCGFPEAMGEILRVGGLI